MGHSVWRESERKEEEEEVGGAHTRSLELWGCRRGEWEGGAAFQRGMMEVFVIGRRDEMRRAVDGRSKG